MIDAQVPAPGTSLDTPGDYLALVQALADPRWQGRAFTLPELQGFCCAVASGPCRIDDPVWMQIALGLDEGEAAATPAGVASTPDPDLQRLLAAFYSGVEGTLAAGMPPELGLEALDEDEEEAWVAGWCGAYIEGVALHEPDWWQAVETDAERELLAEGMSAFFLLSGMLKADAEETGEPWPGPEEEAEWMAEARDELPVIVLGIYQFWHKRRG